MRSRITGFSLIEIMLSTAILVVALMGAMSLIATSLQLQRSSAERTRARSIAIAQIALLRATLNEVSLDEENRVDQFDATINTIGTLNAGTGLIGPLTFTESLVPNAKPATIEVSGYGQEDLAEIELGLVADTLDLNADGVKGTTTVYGKDELRVLPVKVKVTWTPTTATNPNETVTIEVGAILY